jgi:polyisoprenoid-binding protein YceI
MAIPTGSHRLGPGNASLQVLTYREGVAAKVGHDLVIEVTRWEARLEIAGTPGASKLEVSVDAGSLDVREGRRGVKPLTDRDRADIRKTIDDKILQGQPIEFHSTAMHPSDGSLGVDGDLTIAGTTRPVTAQLRVAPDGRVSGTIPLTQSDWGIKPYRGLMGALKVRDEVEISIDATLPAPA